MPSKYITFKDENKDKKESYFILQRDYPHYLAEITTYPDAESLCQVPISGHHLYITFCGTLRGNFIPSYINVEKQIYLVFEDMAIWFFENRISKEPKRYKKWAILK